MFKYVVLIAALTAAPITLAADAVAIERGDFDAQRAAIEQDLADGETYAEISPADRARVREALARMAATLEGGKTADALAEPEKVALFDDQEAVNKLLARAEADSRVTCLHTKALGTHRRTVNCTTAAERARRRDKDQGALQSYQRVIPVAEPIAAPTGGN